MEKLEKDGEFILFLFLVPYYGGMLFEHTLRSDIAEAYRILLWIFSVGFAFQRWLRPEPVPKRRSASAVRPYLHYFAIPAAAFMILCAIGFRSCGLLRSQEKPGVEQKPDGLVCSALKFPMKFIGEPKSVDGSGIDAEKTKDMSSAPVQVEQHYPQTAVANLPIFWKYAPPLELQRGANTHKKFKTPAKQLHRRRFAP